MEGEIVEDLRARVDAVPFWWHSIDLGDGVVTPGVKSATLLQAELDTLGIGDLSGKSVLDIGSYDGFYAFQAERLGAERVVALDHYTWSMDLGGFDAYRRRCIESGTPVEEPHTLADYWRPDTLPGRRGFETAHAALGSEVEVVVADFMDCDLASLGTFDVVLYLGVLYHMRHPLLALERVAAVTSPRGTAMIETLAESFRASERHKLCRFMEGDELNSDASNWWSFNEPAMLAMCREAGFASATLQRAPARWKRRAAALARGTVSYRAVLHASRAADTSVRKSSRHHSA
ncbi:MAG: methyltransferase domain-containing protein [Solirubrobacteraceae bacterium]|nr:methyltransferase domain-containing protein [Solirubrobacteraceae bacterium]